MPEGKITTKTPVLKSMQFKDMHVCDSTGLKTQEVGKGGTGGTGYFTLFFLVRTRPEETSLASQ